MTLILASAIAGFLANFSRRKFSAMVKSRLNNQHTKPSANMLRHFSIDLLSMPESAKQSFTICEIGAAITSFLIPISSIGLSVLKAAFSKSDYDLLGKRPKWFATDASLLANILSWNEDEVYLDQSRNGKLIETWVYQQLAAMADVGGTYGISHYRDGKKREIDFVVERDDGNLLGIEVKSGAVGSSDFSNLKWFAANIAKGTPFTGIVVHSGKDVLPFGDGFYAVPFAALAE